MISADTRSDRGRNEGCVDLSPNESSNNKTINEHTFHGIGSVHHHVQIQNAPSNLTHLGYCCYLKKYNQYCLLLKARTFVRSSINITWPFGLHIHLYRGWCSKCYQICAGVLAFYWAEKLQRWYCKHKNAMEVDIKKAKLATSFRMMDLRILHNPRQSADQMATNKICLHVVSFLY